MPNKIKRKGKKQANKKKAKPKPTIVNRNVINIRTVQTPSSGARIPVYHNDIFDTTPRIERPQELTFSLLENQRKQLELFKTNLLQQQQNNFKTLSDSVIQNLSIQNGETPQPSNALVLYNDELQTQEEEEKYFWDLKQQEKEKRLKEKAKQNEQKTNKIFDKAPEPKETDQIFGNEQKYPKDSIFMNDEPVKPEPKRVQQKLTGKEVQCQYCNKVFASNRGVATHVEHKHPNKVIVEDVEENDV